MNILFYVDHSVASGFGGQERATGSVAAILNEKGYSCYYIYRLEYSNSECKDRDWMFKDNRYIKDIYASKQDVSILLKQWNIGVIIVQGVFDSLNFWRDIIGETIPACKLIFAHHFNPGVEFTYLNYSYYWSIFSKLNSKLSERYWALKQILTGNRQWKESVQRMYRNALDKADRVVLLSKTFVSDWGKIASNHAEDSKICVIPNMLSCINKDSENYAEKEKTVLIVSRLEEKQKRISKALRIWRLIEKMPSLEEWNLVIVGDGPNKEQYQQYAVNHLRRVSFEGYKEPEEFYRKASIFMMTSAYEGWGLTLTEAQQFGCIPIVLNTFSSAKDIINDKHNGFLVNNIWQFYKRLKHLMRNPELRTKMSKNAIESSHRFEKDKVGKMWIDLFNNI